MPQPSITKICLKITCLKFHSKFKFPRGQWVNISYLYVGWGGHTPVVHWYWRLLWSDASSWFVGMLWPHGSPYHPLPRNWKAANHFYYDSFFVVMIFYFISFCIQLKEWHHLPPVVDWVMSSHHLPRWYYHFILFFIQLINPERYWQNQWVPLSTRQHHNAQISYGVSLMSISKKNYYVIKSFDCIYMYFRWQIWWLLTSLP